MTGEEPLLGQVREVVDQYQLKNPV